MARHSECVQCYCGDHALHPDDADYVVEGIPCCSRNCYNTARQGALCFDGIPQQQLTMQSILENVEGGSIMSDYN